ncbi:MAG: peptidylprolyl isomerase fpr4 [Sclerophora amabilis]|nr:MAG: peptidylprolyl isomerase fpr4 [Sclerophora amabilis]
MSGLLPVAVYGLEVPSGDVVTPAAPDFTGATFRITMAAIDPSAPPDPDALSNGDATARATLKIIRQPPGFEEDDSEDDSDSADYLKELLNGSQSDEDEEDENSDESSGDEEEANGGPSDPSKTKKARKEQAVAELKKAIADIGDDMDVDVPNGVNGSLSKINKGKAKATGDEESDEDDDDEEGLEMEEFVICTLDPLKNYQQTLDITVGEDDRVFFKVSGTHSVYLTGNYVVPADEESNRDRRVYDSDEEDYDLSPDEDELDDEDESDELDDLEDPRVTELGSSDEEAEAPKLVKVKKDKGKNKRAAEDSEEEPSNLDDIMAKSLKPSQPAVNGEQKMSKKQQKKMKNNAGEAVATTAGSKAAKDEKVANDTSAVKGDKKVQFAKKLEQGPSAANKDSKADVQPETTSTRKTENPKASLGVKIVQGVTVDDRKLGKGPAAKKGDRVSMRYIGKLKSNNAQFDANKKGKPFSFKLGAGEVIKGWDIGVAGMSVGSERRIEIPANLGYGNKAMPGIPASSTLIFEIKLLEIK